MNPVVEGKGKNIQETEVMEDKKNIYRSGAGEPGKANFPKAKNLTKILNNVKEKDGSNKPDRGDTVVEKKMNRENKIQIQANDTENTTKNNESSIKKVEAIKNKITLRNNYSNLRDKKYNKIMESINKIIQENIHLINASPKSNDPKAKVVKESSKAISKSHIDKHNFKLKEPEEQCKCETVKQEEKELVLLKKSIDSSKAPLPLVKPVNDVKNKSLVINMPKQMSGCKIQDKPKVTKDQESLQSKFNRLPQRKASQTTENYGAKPKRDNINNNSKINSMKMQTEKPKMFKSASTSVTKENRIKKYTLQNAKVKRVKRKNVKNIRTPKNGSQSKLIPTVEDEHAKLYYEAWLNNTVAVTAQEQQVLEDALRRHPKEPVIPDIPSEDNTDKKFTGTIKINYGKT